MCDELQQLLREETYLRHVSPSPIVPGPDNI